MTVIAGWLTNRGDTAGGQTRAGTRLLSLGAGYPTGATTVRSGLVPGGSPCAVTGSGMTVTVAIGRGMMQGSAAAGAYPVAVTSPDTVTVANGDPSNPRRDLVGIRVYDSLVDGSGFYKAQIEIVQGTAAPSPVDPTPPVGANWLPLARLRIPAGASAGSPPTWASVIDDLRVYTGGPGSVIPDPGGTAVGAYVDQLRIRNGVIERWTGSAWVTYSPELPMIKLAVGATSMTGNQYSPISWPTPIARNAAGAGMWSSGTPTRIIFPSPGTYAVLGHVGWPGALGTQTGRSAVTWRPSNTDAVRGNSQHGSTGGEASSISGSAVATAAGQYAEMTVHPGDNTISINECWLTVWQISTATGP
ncbi:hypothetical protein ACU686_40555 [Yinghuangia aomiensis]